MKCYRSTTLETSHPVDRALQEHLITISDNVTPLRIDKFLSDALSISRTKIQEAIGHGLVKINGHIVKSNYMAQPGDAIVADIPLLEMHLVVEPEEILLDIIYEDDQIAIINKPAQMVLYPDALHQKGTLANALRYRYKNLPLKDNLPMRPGLVHRLDKDTSGLLVIAKTAESLSKLERQFYDHSVTRSYCALVWGSPSHDSDTIDVYIGKNNHNPQIISAFPDNQQGKRAITHYQVIKRLHHVSLLSCQLETGRTHQIRVHMKHMGHPIFGDVRYGGHTIVHGQRYASYKAFVNNCLKIMPYQALHAAALTLQHPTTGKTLSFEAALPENFVKVIAKWERYITAIKHDAAIKHDLEETTATA